MALPKNKNLRKLTNNDVQYYWKVEDDTRDFQGLIVTVGMVALPHKRFIFDFRFNYVKLKIASEEEKKPLSEVTPKLIIDAIAFAIKNYNWGEIPFCAFKFELGIFQKIDNEKS